MHNKLTFILPRMAVFTLAAGLGALLLFVVFKLLLVVSAVALIVLAIKAIAGGSRRGYYESGDEFIGRRTGITPMQEFDSKVPVFYRGKQSIVPIN